MDDKVLESLTVQVWEARDVEFGNLSVHLRLGKQYGKTSPIRGTDEPKWFEEVDFDGPADQDYLLHVEVVNLDQALRSASHPALWCPRPGMR